MGRLIVGVALLRNGNAESCSFLKTSAERRALLLLHADPVNSPVCFLLIHLYQLHASIIQLWLPPSLLLTSLFYCKPFFFIESVPLGVCLPDLLWGFDAFYLQFNLSFALMRWRLRDMSLIFIACMSVCAVCDVRTTSGPVLFCHVHSFSCVSVALPLSFAVML